MNIATQQNKKESRDEKAHRIATEIILKERLRREKKTANLRAKRLAAESAGK